VEVLFIENSLILKTKARSEMADTEPERQYIQSGSITVQPPPVIEQYTIIEPPIIFTCKVRHEPGEKPKVEVIPKLMVKDRKGSVGEEGFKYRWKDIGRVSDNNDGTRTVTVVLGCVKVDTPGTACFLFEVMVNNRREVRYMTDDIEVLEIPEDEVDLLVQKNLGHRIKPRPPTPDEPPARASRRRNGARIRAKPSGAP